MKRKKNEIFRRVLNYARGVRRTISWRIIFRVVFKWIFFQLQAPVCIFSLYQRDFSRLVITFSHAIDDHIVVFLPC